MRFLKLFLIVAVISGVCVSAFALDKNRVESAEKLLKVMNMKQQYERIIATTLAMQIKSNPKIAPYKDIMENFFNKYASWKIIKGKMAALYAQEFTVAELNGLIKFYSTPLGKKVLSKMSKLYQKGARIGQLAIQKHLPELQAEIKARASKLDKTKIK